jgi:hypothetical protein
MGAKMKNTTKRALLFKTQQSDILIGSPEQGQYVLFYLKVTVFVFFFVSFPHLWQP